MRAVEAKFNRALYHLLDFVGALAGAHADTEQPPVPVNRHGTEAGVFQAGLQAQGAAFILESPGLQPGSR